MAFSCIWIFPTDAYPLISTDSHSMAAYIFMRWVLVVIYSSQILYFHEIMRLPTVLIVFSQCYLLLCVRIYIRVQDAICKTHEFLVTVSWLHSLNTQTQRNICASCVLCTHGRLWESTQKWEFLNVGSCIISWKWHICEEYMTTKTHRRKIYAAMECESVEITGFLQVRLELWRFENFLSQKWTLISRTSL